MISREPSTSLITHRFGLEEYVSDCVIVLDHKVSEEISTRRLQVVKYRGSAHAMVPWLNEPIRRRRPFIRR